MTASVNEITKLVCPLCEKPLANEEYHKAIQKLDIQAKEKYEKEEKIMRITRNKELEDMRIQTEQNVKQYYDEFLRNKELEDMRIQTEQNVKQYYDEFLRNKENEKERDLLIQRKIFEQFKEKYENEIDNQYKDKFARLTNIIMEKETQMKRAEDEIEILRKKLTKNQSELTGEVGEIDLFNRLREGFKQEQDYFERNKRGTTMGDIIHYIKTSNGILETKIVYDNKYSSTVTNHDIEKAQRYKKIHNTNYVIIVSSNLPKREVKNGLYAQKDGIVLVHPDIVVEVVKQIRQGIIKISNYTKSKIERESKEAELYAFITSDNFSGLLEENQFVYDELMKDQENEEKYLQTQWNKKKRNLKKFKENMSFIRHQIDMITTNSS